MSTTLYVDRILYSSDTHSNTSGRECNGPHFRRCAHGIDRRPAFAWHRDPPACGCICMPNRCTRRVERHKRATPASAPTPTATHGVFDAANDMNQMTPPVVVGRGGNVDDVAARCGTLCERECLLVYAFALSEQLMQIAVRQTTQRQHKHTYRNTHTQRQLSCLGAV